MRMQKQLGPADTWGDAGCSRTGPLTWRVPAGSPALALGCWRLVSQVTSGRNVFRICRLSQLSIWIHFSLKRQEL